MSDTMTAVVKSVAHGKGAEIKSLPIPQPGAGEVLVKVVKAAICGSDHARFYWEPGKGEPPFTDNLILGHEGAGVVEQVGPAVNRVELGQKVAVETHIPCGHCVQCLTGDQHVCSNLKVLGLNHNGCFAQYVLLPQACVVPVPQEMPFEIAAVLEPTGVAYHALSKTRIAGNIVMISGCGPIGLMAVQIAKTLGAAKVLAVAKHAEQAAMAVKMGADLVCASDDDSITEAVEQAGGGYGMGVGIEFAGVKQSVLNVFKSMRKAGEVVLAGNISGGFEFDFYNLLCRKELTVHGQHGRRMYSTWVEVMALVDAGKLNLEGFATGDVPLEEVAEGFELSKRPEQTKVLLSPWS
jgi:threonine 3-dehydrogenase